MILFSILLNAVGLGEISPKIWMTSGEQKYVITDSKTSLNENMSELVGMVIFAL